MLEVPNTLVNAFNDDKFVSPKSDIMSPASDSSDFNVMWNQEESSGNGWMWCLWVFFILFIILLAAGGSYGGWRYYQSKKLRRANKQKKAGKSKE